MLGVTLASKNVELLPGRMLVTPGLLTVRWATVIGDRRLRRKFLLTLTIGGKCLSVV